MASTRHASLCSGRESQCYLQGRSQDVPGHPLELTGKDGSSNSSRGEQQTTVHREVGWFGGIWQGCPGTGKSPRLDECLRCVLIRIRARIAQTSCAAGVTAQSTARLLPGDVC